MKKAALILFVLLTSCSSYKIVRNYELPSDKHVADDCNPMIVKQKDIFGLKVSYHGTILLDDAGSTVNCSESKAMEILRKEACLLGANFVNIVYEARPSIWSICYRCSANFYFAEKDELFFNIIHNERETISFSNLGSIDWDLFRLELPENSEHPYEIYSTIRALPTSFSFRTGEVKNFESEGFFYLDISKIKPSYINDANLEHIRMFVYLTPIYAKKLENFLNTNKASINTHVIFNEIVINFMNRMFKTMGEYMEQTEFGQNQQMQFEWTDKISKLMTELEISK